MDAPKIRRGTERRRFSQERLSNQLLALSMMAAQMVCEPLVPRVSTERLLRVSKSMARGYRASRLPAPSAERLIAQAEIAKQMVPWQVECVAESLVLWTFLRAGGHPAVLQVGCRNILGHVEAHLWVELSGRVLLDEHNEARTWHSFERPLAGGED